MKVKIKQKIREKLEFIYNYRYESSKDYIERLKPLTDSLLDRVEKLERALLFYACEVNHSDHAVESDNGEIARLALKEDQRRKG